MTVSATIILTLGLGHRATRPQSIAEARTQALLDEEPDALIEPV
jgi:hypothetical protein